MPEFKIYLMTLTLVASSCNRTPPKEIVKETRTPTVKEQFDRTNTTDFDSDVVEFTANYLIKRNLFANSMPDDVPPPLTVEKARDWYFIYPLEKKDFDSVYVELFKFGTYSFHDEDRILIKKSTSPKFQVFGDSTRDYDMVMIHRFITQYNKFSDSTKLRLYAYCIDSYSYDQDSDE